MRLFHVGRAALSVVALSVLTACGGGGDDNDSSAYATLTLLTSTAANPAGTYQADRQQKYIDGSELGTLYSFEFDTVSMSIGFSYIKEDPSYYLVGFADDSGEYVCASEALADFSQGELPTCPPGVQVDMRTRTVMLNNTPLYDIAGWAPPVTVSGTIHWD